MTTDSRNGFALACVHCRYRFPVDAPVSFLAAHFDVEHNTTDVKVELVVICDRCDQEMALERTVHTDHGAKHHYGCAGCHRTRIVKQNELPP